MSYAIFCEIQHGRCEQRDLADFAAMTSRENPLFQSPIQQNILNGQPKSNRWHIVWSNHVHTTNVYKILQHCFSRTHITQTGHLSVIKHKTPYCADYEMWKGLYLVEGIVGLGQSTAQTWRRVLLRPWCVVWDVLIYRHYQAPIFHLMSCKWMKWKKKC